MARLHAALFLMCSLVMTAAVASARPMVALKLTASIVHRNADGSVKLTPATGHVLKANDVVRFDIVATNTGDKPAAGLRPSDVVPAGTAFIGRSAAGPGKAEYSTDGGATWSAAPTVIVHDKDGQHVVKADPATYTAVRWNAASALAPGSSQHFSFDVAVK